MRFDPVVPAETLRLLLCDLTSKLAADNQAQSGPGRPRLRGARRSASDACSPCKRARVSEPARCAKSEVASELPGRSGRRGRVTPALRAWSLVQSSPNRTRPTRHGPYGAVDCPHRAGGRVARVPARWSRSDGGGGRRRRCPSRASARSVVAWGSSRRRVAVVAGRDNPGWAGRSWTRTSRSAPVRAVHADAIRSSNSSRVSRPAAWWSASWSTTRPRSASPMRSPGLEVPASAWVGWLLSMASLLSGGRGRGGAGGQGAAEQGADLAGDLVEGALRALQGAAEPQRGQPVHHRPRQVGHGVLVSAFGPALRLGVADPAEQQREGGVAGRGQLRVVLVEQVPLPHHLEVGAVADGEARVGPAGRPEPLGGGRVRVE